METILERTIARDCPMCGKPSIMILTKQEYASYLAYLEGGKLIQDCLPELNTCEREFIKSGYCKDCQKSLFGNGRSDRITS